MKRKVAKLRLSPNEEARVIREEHERRRKLRIQQVREQQRYIALQIRREVEQRRQRELEQLEEELRKDWERQQREKLDTLQNLYQESLKLLGQGHRSAKEHEPDLAAIAQREEENHFKAEERYREALKDLKSQRLKDDERQSRSINARKKALQAEKERSAKVASLPPPLPNPIQSIDSKKPHIVKKSDVSAFAATHYHMPESTVDREEATKQPNAHEGAELQARRLQDLQREDKKRREEQLEKARLRGKEALRREHLVQDRERLLVELEHMQQTDLLRRRQQVSQMPPQIFQPLYKRQETREDFQREIEFAFEDMYTGERRVKGDLVVQLAPEPLPALSTGSQDQELDITLDEIAAQETRNAQHDTDQDAGGTEQETSAHVEPSKPAPRRALKKLLDRIRSQRNQWTDHSSHAPAADSPTAITDQIPERDTTIDTGSLTSEEKDKLPPIELAEPGHSPPVLETTEHSTAADTLPPDVLANRIQEFEERKKREEELESQKQQQVVLLQELEEQKAKLEQMLLEAQQEREDLKAVVTQRLPINQTELSVHDQEATSVTPGLVTELVPPAGEDDHNRRIREYQQRLLEQNRIHKRSVEVARQRLEEYQRALRIRHNMSATSLLSAVVPSVPIRPRLHSAQSVHLPAPLQLPTSPAVQEYTHTKSQTSVEVPTRESDMLASPSRLPSSPVSVGSKSLPDEVESIASSQRNQRPDVTALLTDNIMERVTEHLKERLRPSSEPLPYKLFPTHRSTGIPLQPTSEPIHAISPSVTDGATLVPGHAAVMPGTLLHGSLWTGSLNSRENDDMERQRRELQDVQRRVLEQRQQEEERQGRELQDVQRRVLEQRQQEEERQRRELQDVQRRVLEQRQQEEERQRRELQDVQRRVLEQREIMALQQRQQEEERQRRELQDVQRRVLERREAIALQQRQQEEERQRQEEQRQRQEVEMEQIRRQKETLQALIHTDAQPVPEAASEVLVSENIGQTRLKLLASLLRAIEESNGGTLSHLEDPQERDGSSPQPPSNSDLISRSNVPAGPGPVSVLLPPPPPPRAAKPPVTRVRLGVMDMMTEQHELSAIQEVETPADTSQVTGPEDSVKVPPHTVDRDMQEDSESSVASDTSQQTPSWSSSEQRTAERSTSSGTSSGRSSSVIWRERQLMGAGTSPESSESDLVRRIISPPSSDSGRGADYSGPAIPSYRSPTESVHRPPDSDCLSSTTISTGSYITSDPEQNVNTDKSPSLRRLEQGADSPGVSSPSGQSFGIKESSTEARPGLAVDSLFNDSSIQHIIDRYTRELNISLSTAGKTTDSESSYMEETGSSVSQQSLVRVSERRGEEESSTPHQSLPSDTAGARRSGLERDNTVNPILEHFSGEDTSLAVDQEEDSFRPLIGQLADQSSCFAVDQRDSAMERLVGHPSAHSSMIGQLTGRPVSMSFDQGGWDSTLSRMIGRLSHQTSSHWLSGGQDFYAGQLMGQMPLERSTTWLDESRMRPLVGELDESAGQHSGRSDERTHVDLGVSTEASGPSYPVLPPEAWSHSPSVPAVNPHPQDQTNMDLGPERTEVFPGSDSFHPLLAEVTHNETADPSMTFHQPEHDGRATSPEGQPASGGSRVSTPSEEVEIHTVESEPSPERVRTEDPSGCVADSPASQESFSQLATSQYQPRDSVLVLSPTMMSPEGADADRNVISERLGDAVPFSDLCPVSDKIWGGASEKGILEQSEITLVSLTDTTLQDQETTIAEDEGIWEDKPPDGAREEGQTGHETEGTESTSSPDETPEDKNQTHPDSVMLLEFQWGPSRGLQEVHHEKRRALLQRSSRRVEEIKAKATRAKIQPEVQAPSEAGEQSKAQESQPVTCKEKLKTEPQHKTNTKSKGGQAELHQTTEKSGFIKPKKPQLPPPVSDFRLKKVDEVKSCTPEQRKLDVSEMHQRTQRLYKQLEEVKLQQAIRNRQEACARNRLKAKEFHKKTLQKLRAKQTQTL
ncbi:centrosomal protein of 295 kDa isoform X2 [Perca fluviatilis]|uniref:centrosomal protein of 295 kDa isoform X2 n=1 Tax=Perca fluviatilis TaxID=8168 RepID=UPI0019644283|nr:centrosomal protein of 295 kDa isoform X2 [Perca fluviatilis]